MNVGRLSVTALIFSVFLLSTVQAADAVNIVYKESLEQFSLRYVARSGAQKPQEDPARSMQFEAFGKRFDIRLESNHSLLSAADRSALPSNLEVYRGDIADMPNSWVRLVVVDGLPRGVLWDGEEMYAVEVAAAEPFIFRLSDLHIAPGALSCSEIGAAKDAGSMYTSLLKEVSKNAALGPGATSQVDVAVIGDFEFTSDKGANASAALVARMNIVDGIFSSQLGVQINANRIDTFPAANDPFTDESDASLLIDELADFRANTPTQNANGLSHLFTGRELDGTTVGIAFGGALCSPRFGAGLTQGTNSETLDSLIAAHEIGHNFGAPHDGTSGSACEAEAQDFLMAPRLNGSDQFSACSITEMLDDVNRASCISPLPSTDMTVISGGALENALLGNNVTITFEANSVGTNAAGGVILDVVIPSGVTFSNASADAGTCTSGAGSVSCVLGSIAAGSGVTVAISVAASSVGDSDFVATVTADVDENGNNNQATVQLTVDPAVDLVTTAAGAAQVGVDQSTTIRPVIENRAAIAASNVVLTVTADAGMRIDSASWAPGTCTITNGDVSCQANSLAAQSNDTLDLQVTGLSAGSQSYAMSISGGEADRDTTNNDATGQVNVSSGSTNQGGDSGGSGSLGWVTLLLLLLGRLSVLRRSAN